MTFQDMARWMPKPEEMCAYFGKLNLPFRPSITQCHQLRKWMLREAEKARDLEPLSTPHENCPVCGEKSPCTAVRGVDGDL